MSSPRRSAGLSILCALALTLSAFYLTTARVYEEGALGSSYLVLKPSPSFAIFVGGGEQGAWTRAHPGQPPPWWQSEHATKLLWGGDWEDPAIWPVFHSLGLVLTPLLWLCVALIAVKRCRLELKIIAALDTRRDATPDSD